MATLVWSHKLKAYRALSRILDPALIFIEYAIVVLACAMMAVAFVQVTLRYGLNRSFFGSEELARFLFSWFIFFSAALGLERGIHFSVDLLVNALSRIAQRFLSVIVKLIVLGVLAILLVKGVELTIKNWTQLSPAMQVPLSYPYAAIPVSSAVMILIVLRQLLRPAESSSAEAG